MVNHGDVGSFRSTTGAYHGLVQELDLMLRACYGLIYLVAVEEDPVDEVLAQVASLGQPPRIIRTWDVVRGWNDNGADKGALMPALARIAKAPPQEANLFVLKDAHPFLKPTIPTNIPHIRQVRNLVADLKAQNSRATVVWVSRTLEIPPDLTEDITVLDFPLPAPVEIDHLIGQLVVPDKLKVTGLAREQLVKACQGLSRARIRRVLAKALAAKQQVNEADIEGVLAEKQQAIRQTGILEFFHTQETLSQVGGLEALKQWVRLRQDAFTDEARRYGLPNPKGVLLVGIQGTGKSLSAKTIAHEWRLPLLRLDAGRLFSGLVGESENRARQMVQLAEAMSPCVLWIDEIDKAFGNVTSGSDGDSGTSRRVFGSLITWMQEKTAPVFIVATANNVQVLPAELLRKGRFDEIFFLNLPTERERREIFRVHLQRLRPSRLREFDLDRLAQHSPQFSGAEIEQVVIDAMHRAFGTRHKGSRRDFNTDDILRAISETVPLAAIAKDQIEALKRWAALAGARTASEDTQLSEEIRQYGIQQGINPLEVD
jgi:SpoVK/Ycf46/Vps4 family AAA+-type ATPase